MSRRARAALAVFGAAVFAGTLLDRAAPRPAPRPGLLVADLHVHPFPGDGALTVYQLQREALRRGIDVVAITGHNNRVGLRLAHAFGVQSDAVIVLEGQEVTAPGFHVIAAATDRPIDWRLSAADAIAAIHAAGGVAIAAHPLRRYHAAFDDEALRLLDGGEVAHPLRLSSAQGRRELEEFYDRARSLNPHLAAIGSSDFHMTAPLGLCRTYLLTDDRSAAGALEAIRRGRTVAADAAGRLYGRPEHVAAVAASLAARPGEPVTPLAERAAALLALLALAALTLPRARR
ncbi:MAG TPA: CehA/McbA family metallohydrolase [Vicinamibacterales bacterium]|nr:CehA/McbA family metallohydrolase [Vicinamibacterales bacterium]